MGFCRHFIRLSKGHLPVSISPNLNDFILKDGTRSDHSGNYKLKIGELEPETDISSEHRTIA